LIVHKKNLYDFYLELCALVEQINITFLFLGLIVWNGDESKLGLKLNQVLILCEIQQVGLKTAPEVP